MTRLTANNGNEWIIHGITCTPSDFIVETLLHAINNKELDPSELQVKTGHRAPIVIDYNNHVINFQRW